MIYLLIIGNRLLFGEWPNRCFPRKEIGQNESFQRRATNRPSIKAKEVGLSLSQQKSLQNSFISRKKPFFFSLNGLSRIGGQTKGSRPWPRQEWPSKREETLHQKSTETQEEEQKTQSLYTSQRPQASFFIPLLDRPKEKRKSISGERREFFLPKNRFAGQILNLLDAGIVGFLL
jgi:hypothetical protein